MGDVLSASDESPGPLTDESDAAVAADETGITLEPSDDDLLDTLGDDASRSVLLACDRAPMAAEELAENCEASESAIYRRLETFSSLGLVERTQRVDAPSKTCYETAVDDLSIHFDGSLRVETGSNDYVIDAMRTLLATIDVQQLAYDRERNSVDTWFRLAPTLLDSLVELYVRDTDSCERQSTGRRARVARRDK